VEVKKNKYVVYTALFGNYDDLLPPAFSDECDYVCFTDDPNLKSDSWKIIVVAATMPAHMMNRLYKLKPHRYLSDYQASIYVDSNVEIKKDPRVLLEKYLGTSDFLAVKHVERDCIFSEALCCIASRKTECSLTLKQMHHYATEGYPAKNGLFENRVLIRSHNKEKVVHLAEMWWKEINSWTQRDQLSLCYVAWVEKIDIQAVSENPRFENDYFKWYPHKGSENIFFLRLIRKLMFYVRWVSIVPLFLFRVRGLGVFNFFQIK